MNENNTRYVSPVFYNENDNIQIEFISSKNKLKGLKQIMRT